MARETSMSLESTSPGLLQISVCLSLTLQAGFACHRVLVSGRTQLGFSRYYCEMCRDDIDTSHGDVARARWEEHRPLQGVQALRREAATTGKVRTVGDRERPNPTSRDLLGGRVGLRARCLLDPDPTCGGYALPSRGAGLVEQLPGSRSCMIVGACLST